jgi:hypothetical protein
MNEITKLYLITDLYNMKLCQKWIQSVQEYGRHKLRDETSWENLQQAQAGIYLQ